MARREDHGPDSSPPANHALAGLRALRDGLPDGPLPAAEDDVEPASPRGAARLVVRRERKGHGGKPATRVEGLALADDARRSLARDVKRALGVGARWDGEDLLVQGGEVERVATWFEARGHAVVLGTR